MLIDLLISPESLVVQGYGSIPDFFKRSGILRNIIFNLKRIKIMDSKELAQYLEVTNGISKPWLLVQLRLKKLQERQAIISEDTYAQELEDIHQDLMNLGEWWRGIEDQVF